MSLTVHFVANNKGIGELMRSKGVQDHLQERATRMKAQADADVAAVLWPGSDPVRIEVQNHTTTRARMRVVALDGRAMALEAKYRFLGRSIDAAR